MQRIDEVLDILECSFKIYRNKNFPIASLIEKFPIFSVNQHFDKNQFQAIQKKRNAISKISELFSEEEFTNEFDISKLKNLLSIIQSTKISIDELSFFADFALNQYISFILIYEKTNSIQNIDILFSVLSEFSNLDFQNIINESIRDLLILISNNMTKNLFSETFTPISDYFLFKVGKHQISSFNDDRKTFSLIPLFLKHVYELNDFENSEASKQIWSFLSLLFAENSKYFSQEAFSEMYNVIKPHLDNMDISSIIIMKDLINYIDKETVTTYFRELPKNFEKIVEKEEQPYVQSPIFLIKDDSKSSSIKYKSSITINPSQSPECLFRFSNVSSFINGLDLSKNPCNYLPQTYNFREILSPNYFYLIDLISKSLIRHVKNHDEESLIFVDSFSKFIDEEKQGSKYEFDYICILIFYWIKLDIRHIKLPNNLLNPTTSLKIEKIVENDENKKLIYFTINYLTLMKILQNGESCFNSILTNYVKYPHFLAELFEICFMQITNLSAMISQHTWIVRTFRLIALQLQTSEFAYLTSDFDEMESNENKTIKNANNDFFIEVIEEARLSIFRLFSELFQYNSFLKLFLSDFLFLSFFLSLLFEVNIRQFVLMQLQKYLMCNISKENLNKFNFQLTQMINQIYPSLNDNKEGMILIEDIIKMMNSVKSNILNNIDQIQPFCQALTTTFDFLDNSDHSRQIFYEIISLFTLVPGIQLDSIEKPLKNFGKISNDEYQSLLNLLASRILTDSISEFEIKNGNLMNIIFRVFLNHSEVDIIGLSTKLCTYSHKNCFILHRCKYDILILDYVLKHRNDEEGSESLVHIPSILNNVVLISSVVSSPAVVRKFISLFIPIDNRYISTIHHLLLNPLKMILERAQEIPWSTFSLSQTVSIPIDSMKQQLDKDSFTFTCWIYFEGVVHNSKRNEKINILTLLNSEMKPFFNFSIVGNVFFIQDKETNIQMPKKIWEFVSIIYTNEKVQLFIEDQEICEINVDVNFPFGLITVCIGGINSVSISDLEKNNQTQNNDINNFVAQICNINILSKHFPQLPAIIYKFGPRVTQKKFKSLLSFDQSSMSKIAGYSTHAQNRNFADILLRFFKAEILLPFFAQIDLKLVNGKPSNFKIIDVVSVFKEALSAGEVEQNEFCKKHGFSIISHLLMFASPKQITYDLYLNFYEIYEILLSEDIKKNMFKNILINFDIWIVAEHQDHMQILVHWRKLIPRYDAFFIEFFRFSRLLEIMRTYYWYSPIEKEKIIGEPQIYKVDDDNNSILHHSRNPNLKISDIRSMLFTILYEISKLQFLDDDFSTLMDHCINIRDKKQRYDLLCFMNTIANADFYPFQQITNTLQTLSRISILLHSDDKKVISTVLNIICSVHMHSDKQSNEILSLDQNLEVVMKNIEISSMNIDLLNELLILINQKIYNLFPVCSYISYVIGEIKLYQDIDPSQDFVVSPNWAIWSVCEALNQNDLHSSFTIFQFLVCCSHKEWKNIYDTIEIVGQAMKMDEITIDQYKTTFLKVVCLCILNTDTLIPSDVFDSLFALLKQHIFFRTKDGNNTFSRAIESLYKNSPFYSKEEQYLNQVNENMIEFSFIKKKKNDFLLNQEDFLKLDLVNHTYKFGFNINENLTWADKDIAQQILMLVTKFREKTKGCIKFAIIIAAFLCHGCVEFVKSQLSEIQLTEKEISDFSPQIDFLYAKLKGLSSSFTKDNEKSFENDPDMDFLMKKQLSITEIMRNASNILDDLKNVNNETDNSYVKLFKTYVNYINDSTEKMFSIEGKSKVSNKNQSGMSSDTEFSSHINEESSTDKENGSFNSKIESSDDVENYENSFFEHEEDNDSEIDSENDKSIQFSKIDLCEEIRDRMEINSKRWKTLWSNVVMDGAPWDSSLISGKPTVIRWKRDNTFCRYFCPFKMKRNQRPNDHIDASFARDAGCFSAATKLLEVHNQKLHEEYLKSAPPILLEINQPSSLNSSSCLLKPNKSQSSFQPRSPGSLKRRKKIKSQSIKLISPENSRSNINTNFSIWRKKSRSKLRKTFSFECEYLKIRGLKRGKLVFSNDKIHFIEEDDEDVESSHKTRVINLREITHVFMRNRFHIKSAIEIFLSSGKSYFFNFPNNKSSDIINKIAVSIQQLDNSTSISNQFSTLKQPVLQNEESPRFFKSQKFTEDWVSRKMSNFEYLMKLNIYSERTFNDASQYPFFPWVLSNYTSEMIDLKDRNNYRDLSKPIGAMNEDRLNELLQRMNDMSFFADTCFLYSSFAICPLSVYLWFVRIEPFTTLHIMMQSNKFDHPSRLFSSIPTSYKLVTTHLNDYRELPPEFFFMPEFLFNDNGFDLGATRGRKINDVVLPRWVSQDQNKDVEDKSKQKLNDKQNPNENTNDSDKTNEKDIDIKKAEKEKQESNENKNENEEGNDENSQLNEKDENNKTNENDVDIKKAEKEKKDTTENEERSDKNGQLNEKDENNKTNEKEGDQEEKLEPGPTNSFSSGAECVYMLRKALESEEVSSHLNEWIDLFWGFKQRGEEAKKALNLYNPNMYDSAWTPQTLKDPQKRAEIESTMCHVGQIPPQMFTEPHPKRDASTTISVQQESLHSTLATLPCQNITNAFIYTESNGNLIFCLFCNNDNKDENNKEEEIKKKRFVYQASYSFDLEKVLNVRESEINNEVICIDFQSSLSQIIAAQSTGKLVNFIQSSKNQNLLEPKFLIPELSNVSQFATSGEFVAVVSDDATLNLYEFGRSRIEYKIEFYGDQITCCDVSQIFSVAACGTVSGRIVLCSLFEGKKVCVIPLINDAFVALKIEINELKPVKVLITDAWGFILTYSEAIDVTGHKKLLLFLHNINGHLIRCVDVGQFPISCWSSFRSKKDFDYIVMANSKGMVFVFEAFYLNVDAPLFKCYNRVVAVGCSVDNCAIVALKEDGNVIVSSICID